MRLCRAVLADMGSKLHLQRSPKDSTDIQLADDGAEVVQHDGECKGLACKVLALTRRLSVTPRLCVEVTWSPCGTRLVATQHRADESLLFGAICNIVSCRVGLANKRRL